MHIIPKKGGITVVKDDKNELVTTRTITGLLHIVLDMAGKSLKYVHLFTYIYIIWLANP